MADAPADLSDHSRAHLVRRLLFSGAVMVAIVIAVLFVRAGLGAGRMVSTDDATLESDITPIAARVAGYVAAVPAEDFARVRKGALLAQQDDRDYRAAVAKASADLATQVANLAAISAQSAVQHANVAAAEANLAVTAATETRNRRERERQTRLIADGVGSQQVLDGAIAALDQNTAQLAQNRAQIAAARSQLGVLAAQAAQARAAVAAAGASLELARVNLDSTRIVAPADGTLGARQVRPGQYLPAGGQVFAFVPQSVWVIANFKETQLVNARLGQAAHIDVDAVPGHRLMGRVIAFAPASGAKFALIPADNASGNFTKIVQRVAVKIALTDFDGVARDRLRAGQSVTATIDTGSGR